MRGLYIKSIPFGKGTGGGGITHTLGMIRGFWGANVDMTVVTSNAFDIEGERVINLNVPYKATGLPFIREYIFFHRYQKALLSWLKEHGGQFDFIYCRHRIFSSLPLETKRNLNAYLILEMNDVLHDAVWNLALYPNMKKQRRILRPFFYLAGFFLKRWVKHIELPVIQYSDKIVVVSEQVKKMLVDSGYKNSDSIIVLPNGVDPDQFRPDEAEKNHAREKMGIPENHIVIGFAGTFGNWHGIPELTETFRRIAPEKNVSFLLMGDGLLRKEMQEKLSSFTNVHFTGLVPFSEMPSHLNVCDILVISNSWDPKFGKPFFGSPTKLFEYMSMGKAIVASRLEQIGEILKDGESALLYSPGSVDEMETAIRQLIDDKSLRKRLGVAARESVILHHTWKMNAEQIEQCVSRDLRL